MKKPKLNRNPSALPSEIEAFELECGGSVYDIHIGTLDALLALPGVTPNMFPDLTRQRKIGKRVSATRLDDGRWRLRRYKRNGDWRVDVQPPDLDSFDRMGDGVDADWSETHCCFVGSRAALIASQAASEAMFPDAPRRLKSSVYKGVDHESWRVKKHRGDTYEVIRCLSNEQRERRAQRPAPWTKAAPQPFTEDGAARYQSRLFSVAVITFTTLEANMSGDYEDGPYRLSDDEVSGFKRRFADLLNDIASVSVVRPAPVLRLVHSDQRPDQRPWSAPPL